MHQFPRCYTEFLCFRRTPFFMDHPYHSMRAIFEELQHLERETVSSVYYFPYTKPSTGNFYHPSTVFDPCTQHHRPKLESEPSISEPDFYLSEDEMKYLNEIFKIDQVVDSPIECSARNKENRCAEGTNTIHHDQKSNKNQTGKTKTGTSRRGIRESRFTKSSTLELEEIQKYFDFPITLAAKKMNVGLTVLKRRCRELKIMRWPHRKIKSLRSLISNVKELGLEKETEMLEEHRMIVEKMPQVELTEKAKKLRQACFKANYKKRRQMQDSSRCHFSYSGNC